MASKAVIIKFSKVDKASYKGKVGHSRTGACKAKGQCFHGKNYHVSKGAK